MGRWDAGGQSDYRSSTTPSSDFTRTGGSPRDLYCCDPLLGNQTRMIDTGIRRTHVPAAMALLGMLACFAAPLDAQTYTGEARAKAVLRVCADPNSLPGYRATTSAMSRSLITPPSSSSLACMAASEIVSTHCGAR